jgi:hypothetical protein
MSESNTQLYESPTCGDCDLRLWGSLEVTPLRQVQAITKDLFDSYCACHTHEDLSSYAMTFLRERDEAYRAFVSRPEPGVEMLTGYIEANLSTRHFARRELDRLEEECEESLYPRASLYAEISDCKRVIADCDAEVKLLVAQRDALVSQDEEEDPWEGMEPWERAACDPDYAAALADAAHERAKYD